MSPLQLMGVLLATATAVSASVEHNVTIMQIQGREDRSPLEGEAIITEGVVTLCTRDHRRCWIQDEHGDGDAATSDGIVLDLQPGRSATATPHPGDLVRVEGRVRERQFGTGLPLTEISRIRSLSIRSRGHQLPDAVPIRQLPDVSIPRAIVFWESLEGMRVRIDEAVVVGPTTRHGEFALLAAANARPGSGYESSNSHLLLRPLRNGEVDYNPERVLVDDAAAPALQLRPGDRVRNLVGVVDYGFGNYKIQYRTLTPARHSHPSPPQPPADLSPDELRLVSFNLENFFDTERTPGKEDQRSTPSREGFETKLRKLSLALIEVLQLPEIIAVQEAENTAVLTALAERINSLRHSAYRAISFDSSDPRGIEVGLLWDSKRVSLRRAAPLDPRYTRPGFGRDSVSPGREPLVGEFEHRGRLVTVVVNHFKSKSGDDPLFGRRQPPLRPTEQQRKLQAQAVRAFVDDRLRQDPHALIAVVGDLNDFSFAEPGEGADHPLAILRGTGPDRLESLTETVPEPQRYSFIYEGNSQLLDHILVSPTLRDCTTGTRIVHFNADYPATLHNDPTTPLRVSDHDPIEATFRLP